MAASIPATMKAAQYDGRDNKIYINTVPVPSPEPGKLLIKIAAASLCHSDVMLFERNDQGLMLGKNPVTMGHEAAGTVVGLGEGVTGFKEGDQVGFLPALDCCFECEPCMKTHNAWCRSGCLMQGFGADGYFAEYAAVEARGTMVLPDGMDPVYAAPLFCAGVTAFHGIEDCGLEAGKWIAVIGTGGLGHLGVQYAKKMGLRVIGIDVSEDQLVAARECGADVTFNPTSDAEYVSKIKEMTDGGVDAAVNFTANKKAYDDMPAIIKLGTGVYMVVGIPNQALTLNALDVALGRFKVKGSSNGMSYNMRPAIEFSAKHGIKPHITFSELEQLPEMIETMHQGKTRGRLAVKF